MRPSYYKGVSSNVLYRNMEYIELTNNGAWILSEKLDASGFKYLKVPIAILGKWKHSVYGDVEFTQQDFTDIIDNWKEGRAGYEPPLFIGHPITVDTMEGAPAAGWPEKIYQENDVLYGDFAPTDDQLFTDVKSEKYRYASAEVLRKAKNKETGESIGTLLVGTALTNRPFLPLRQYTVQAMEQKFSDVTSPTLFSFNLQSREITTMSNQEVPVAESGVTSEAAVNTPLQSNVAPVDPVVKLSDTPVLNTPQVPTEESKVQTVPKDQYDSLQQEFSQLAKEFSDMKQQFSSVIEKEQKRAVEEKLSKLDALDLPQSTKQTFGDMIRSGTLSAEAEEKLFSNYQQLSEQYKHVFSSPQGEQKPEASSSEPEMPEYYSDLIKQNNQISSQRIGLQAQIL